MNRRRFLKTTAIIAGSSSFGSGILASSNPISVPFKEHPGDEAYEERDNHNDAIGYALGASFIWSADLPQNESGNLYAAFRKDFQLPETPDTAILHLFAYTRYRLYINGRYVLRGPARFQNNGPQYDTVDVGSYLKSGKNSIAVLVFRDMPTGRIMFHQPGLTLFMDAELPSGRHSHIHSDSTWKATRESSFLDRPDCWGSIIENIDARKMPGEWTDANFDASAWPHAISISPLRYDISAPAETMFAPLRARSIPLLKEEPVPESSLKISFIQPPNKHSSFSSLSFPQILHSPAAITIDIGLVQQAYTVMDFEATEGSKILAHYYAPDSGYSESSYICRAGRQTWMSGDTYGMVRVVVHLISGQLTLQGFKVVAVNYPFECVGSFECSDPMLNSVWEVSTRSLEVLSEDAYVDCADRERVEWMDNSPPAYELSRLTMAGSQPDGSRLYSDPRLHRDMLRRIALTQQKNGIIKAHSCSERWDIHAVMLDRACDWVNGIHLYYEHTGDRQFLEEMFPFVQRLMAWFLKHRTQRGLVQAAPYYEWVVWGNPMGYQQCEGTCLNAYVFGALNSAAFIAKAIGRKNEEDTMRTEAATLGLSINKNLWNDKEGSYYSGIFAPEIKPVAETMNGKFHLHLDANGVAEADLWAAVFCMREGVVPDDRKSGVMEYISRNLEQSRGNNVMINYYLAELFYAQGNDRYNKQALDIIRKHWELMTSSPWQTTWEDVNGGSRIHIYGVSGAIPLCSRVLGVDLRKPVWTKQISIDPRLGDLSYAKGVVSTELGPVEVSWKKNNQLLDFTFTIPAGAEAEVCLPCGDVEGMLRLNGNWFSAPLVNGHVVFKAAAGRWEGTILQS